MKGIFETGLTSSPGLNVSPPAVSATELCALIGEGWDCHGSATATGFLLELFRLPRSDTTLGRETCDSYLLLPAENTWRYELRAFLYACGLLYCFVGLGAITAVFMEAMGNVVKQTRQVVRTDKATGIKEPRQEKIWNSTVADITLLALGTSFPQISLAMIDAIQHLGALTIEGVGPGTVLGSAAFNLFMILAVCVLVPRGGEVKRIEKMGVFLVELAWSIWAYIWLFFILKVSSPSRVALWEAVLTVLQFPLLVLHAYGEDQNWSFVSLAFWTETVKGWTQASGISDIDPSRGQFNGVGRDSPDSGGSQHSHILFGNFRHEDFEESRPSIYDTTSARELLAVSSEQNESPHCSRNDEADYPSVTHFRSGGEAVADHPAVISLRHDSEVVTQKNFSLGDRWRAQLFYAMTVQGSAVNEVPPKMSVLLRHAVTVFWRILFAFIIPADVWHGWPTFLCALLCIAGISAVAIQLANLLGCVSGVNDYVIAITILASGTSWPDLVGSKIAVEFGATADTGIANINASNCIQVFMGIGLPWLIQVCYNRLKLHGGLSLETSGLTFSVLIYFITSTLCWCAVMARRRFLGGELGGPRKWAIATSAFFTCLWLTFILFSCLKVYNFL